MDTLLAPVSFCQKPNILIFSPKTEGPVLNRHGNYNLTHHHWIVVDGPWLRQKLGIVALIKTGPAELLSCFFCLFSFVMFVV